MNNNFASFGTALSRNEAKMVAGGDVYDSEEGEGGGGGGACANHYEVCGCGTECCQGLTCTQNTNSTNYCGI